MALHNVHILFAHIVHVPSAIMSHNNSDDKRLHSESYLTGYKYTENVFFLYVYVLCAIVFDWPFRWILWLYFWSLTVLNTHKIEIEFTVIPDPFLGQYLFYFCCFLVRWKFANVFLLLFCLNRQAGERVLN